MADTSPDSRHKKRLEEENVRAELTGTMAGAAEYVLGALKDFIFGLQINSDSMLKRSSATGGPGLKPDVFAAFDIRIFYSLLDTDPVRVEICSSMKVGRFDHDKIVFTFPWKDT